MVKSSFIVKIFLSVHIYSVPGRVDGIGSVDWESGRPDMKKFSNFKL